MSVNGLLDSITAIDESVRSKARTYTAQLLKAPSALGRLETLGGQLCAISGSIPPDLPHPAALVVFAADHGVTDDDLTRWPPDASARMTRAMCEGTTALVSIARALGVGAVVVDVGLRETLDGVPMLQRRKVRCGTDDIQRTEAMSVADVEAAMGVGIDVAEALLADGARCLVPADLAMTGDTAANALIATILGVDADALTARQGSAVEHTAARHRVLTDVLARSHHADDTFDLLADIGGLEIAAIVGFLLAAAEHRVPVILDGTVALSAALVAVELCPPVRSVLVAGHRSDDVGARLVLERLRLEPVLDLDVRMGDGTGAILALPMLVAAAAALRDMATFESAGIPAVCG